MRYHIWAQDMDGRELPGSRRAIPAGSDREGYMRELTSLKAACGDDCIVVDDIPDFAAFCREAA